MIQISKRIFLQAVFSSIFFLTLFSLGNPAFIFAAPEKPKVKPKVKSEVKSKNLSEKREPNQNLKFNKKIKKLDKKDEKRITKIYNFTPIIITPPEVEIIDPNILRAPFISTIPVKNDESGGKNLSEVIMNVQGVHLKKWGGRKNFSTISIRGSDSSQVVIYLNATPLNSSSQGGLNLSDILLTGVQRIEIYKDSPPPEFAAGAIGGVINIVTNAKNEPGRFISIGYGSFQEMHLGAGLQKQIGNWIGNFLINGQSDKGNFRYLNKNGTIFQNTTDDYYTTRKNNDSIHINQSAFLNYDQKKSAAWTWKIIEQLNIKTGGIPGSSAKPILASREESYKAHFLLEGEKKNFVFKNLKITLRGYSSFRQDGISDPEMEISLGGTEIKRIFTDTGGSLGFKWIFPSQELSVYQYFKLERYNSSLQVLDFNQNASSMNEENERLSLQTVLQDEIFLVKGKDIFFTVLPGFRFKASRDKNSSPNYQVGSASETAFTPVSKSYRFFSPSMGVLLRLFQRLSLKGNIRKSYRLPSFLELYGSLSQILGNPALKPENALIWDVGFVTGRLFSKAGSSFLGNHYFEYSFFHRKTENEITLTQNSQNTAIFLNIEKTTVSGHEFFLSMEFFRHLLIKVNYTYQKSENLSPIPYYYNKQLPFRPNHEVSIRTEIFRNYHQYLLKIFIELNQISGTFRDRVNRYFYYIPDRKIFNLGLKISRDGRAKAAILFEVKNILNEDSEDITGYPLPGRSFYISNWYSF